MVRVGRVEVVALAADLLPAREGGAVGAEVGAGLVRVPGHPAGDHPVVLIEVVALTVDVLLPAHRLEGSGAEVVGLAAVRLQAGGRRAVGSEVGPGAVGVPGDPAGHHPVVLVEVVELPADRLLPLHGLEGLGTEVVGLAVVGSPAGDRRAVGAEVGLAPVAVPRQPAVVVHRAIFVEVVEHAVDPLFPLHRSTIGAEVVRLSPDGLPALGHVACGVIPVLLAVDLFPRAIVQVPETIFQLVLVAILPSLPVLRLIGITLCDVVHHIVAKRCDEFDVGHRVFDSRILVKPVSAVVLALFYIGRSAALAKQVGHTPHQALDAVGAIIDVDAHCLERFADAIGRIVIFAVSPSVLKLRELRRIGLVGSMPCGVQVIAELGERAVGSSGAAHIPAIAIADDFKAAVAARVVVVDRLEEIAQPIAIIELEITHGVIAVA